MNASVAVVKSATQHPVPAARRWITFERIISQLGRRPASIGLGTRGFDFPAAAACCCGKRPPAVGRALQDENRLHWNDGAPRKNPFDISLCFPSSLPVASFSPPTPAEKLRRATTTADFACQAETCNTERRIRKPTNSERLQRNRRSADDIRRPQTNQSH
jgi:hypothetical protein